jgi:hypothetical protein
MSIWKVFRRGNQVVLSARGHGQGWATVGEYIYTEMTVGPEYSGRL